MSGGRLHLLACLVAFAAPALSACDSAWLTGVRRYNEAVIDAYRTGDTSRLHEVAERREVERVQRRIAIMKADGLVLESELELLEETSAEEVSADGRVVFTRERWRYHNRPVVPGRLAGPEIVSLMTLRYEMLSRDGPWKVIKARTLTNEYLEPKGYTHSEESHGRVGEGTPEEKASKVFLPPPGGAPDAVRHGAEVPPATGGEKPTSDSPSPDPPTPAPVPAPTQHDP